MTYAGGVNDEGSEIAGEVEVRVLPGDPTEMPVVYANNLQVTIGPHDMTLLFGVATFPYLTAEDTEPGSRIDLQPDSVVRVVLPITLVPSVLNVIESQLEVWPQIAAGLGIGDIKLVKRERRP